jgi:uracil-DNA glycosylase
VESDLAPTVLATVHPSSILRSDNREAEMKRFVKDLKVVAKLLQNANGAA